MSRFLKTQTAILGLGLLWGALGRAELPGGRSGSGAGGLPDIRLDHLEAPQKKGGSSKARSKNEDQPSEPFLSLQTSFRRNGGVDEFRGNLLRSNFVSLTGVTPDLGGKLSVTSAEIELRALAFHDAGSLMMLELMLPINSVSSSNAELPQGSEFGGYGVSLLGRTAGAFQYRLGFRNNQSSKLKLYDQHNEAEAGFYAEIHDGSVPATDVAVLLGPEVSYPFVSGSAPVINYGLQWGARVTISADTGIGTRNRWRYTLEAMLRRATSYEVQGENQGGAGLLSVMPAVEYNLIESLWIGALVELPVFRPKGNEASFGRVDLPGLFGPSVGITIRAAAL